MSHNKFNDNTNNVWTNHMGQDSPIGKRTSVFNFTFKSEVNFKFEAPNLPDISKIYEKPDSAFDNAEPIIMYNTKFPLVVRPTPTDSFDNDDLSDIDEFSSPPPSSLAAPAARRMRASESGARP